MMRIMLTTLLSLVLAAAAQVTTDAYNEQSNTIEPKPTLRLDPYIRKALLRALSDLETDDPTTTEIESTFGSSTAELLKPGDEVTEVPTEASKDTIQYHSFLVNGQSAFVNISGKPQIVDKKISIITSTAGNVESRNVDLNPTQNPFNEITANRDSTHLQHSRNVDISTLLNYNQVNSVFQEEKSEENSSTTARVATTTTTTTTTSTTPKPTHNADGENIEAVSNRDIQVFQAPLVAAFTVHQDALGLPRKVIPIFQQNKQTLSLPSSQSNTKSISNDFLSQQLALQKELELKQRILEEQLRLLQLQQQQQEEFLRKQQIFLQQKELDRQGQQISLEREQTRRQTNLQGQQQASIASNTVQTFSQGNVQVVPSNSVQLPQNTGQLPQNIGQLPLQNSGITPANNNGQSNNFQTIQSQFTQNNGNLINPLSNTLQPPNNGVQIQPSLNLSPRLPLTNQQLPSREAVDFLLHLRSQKPDQFPLQDNHLPAGISAFHQQLPIPFNQPQNFNSIGSLDDQFLQKHGSRVFRHESGTGNFGSNNFNNNFRFNAASSFGPSRNRFFPNRHQHFVQTPEEELQQLLLRSGLNTGGRPHDDLNIVSKVLSLNHGVQTNHLTPQRLNGFKRI